MLTRSVLKFGPFEVDASLVELRKKGARVPIQEKPLRVLAALAERQGELVTRAELHEHLWQGETVSFTAFFGNGARAFPTQSPSYPVGNTYVECPAIMQGNFQSQANSADLAIECNNPSLANVLVYLNSGSGAFTLSQTLSAGSAFVGVEPGVALGVLNSQAAIFIASQSNSLVSYQSNGLKGGANTFTSVSMIPVGLAPHGSIAVLDNPPTGAVDFDVNGVGISTFTSYSQSGTSVNGTWNSTPALGPGGVFAAGFSPNLDSRRRIRHGRCQRG